MPRIHSTRVYWFILFVFFTIVFKFNCLDPYDKVANFQLDSEELAVGSYAASYYQLDKKWFGLGRLNSKDVKSTTEKGNRDWNTSEKIYRQKDADKNHLSFGPYGSQLGWQGQFYSLISRHIYFKNIKSIFQYMNCLLLSATILGIVYLLISKYGKKLAAIWGIVFILSPWIVNFAKNLYWVEFTWFLPMLVGLAAVSPQIHIKHKNMVLALLAFLTIGIKASCGYEYISTVMAGMVLFPATDMIYYAASGDKNKAKELLKIILSLALGGLAGFFAVMCIHAYYRGNGNIISGLINIYHRDILRRTVLGSQNNFNSTNPSTMRSINASVFSVILTYFKFYTNAFKTDIILGIRGGYFILMTLLAFGFAWFRHKGEPIFSYLKDKEIVLLVLSMMATLSWIVLAKSHSYIHIHMNFVLWYFGYVQMCMYLIVVETLRYLKLYLNRN